MSDPIVVGTDGSASAELAVDRAGELAQALGTDVCIVNAYPSASRDKGGHAAAEKIVAQARDRLQAGGIVARTHVGAGDPPQVLITAAADEHAQIIVVGNLGMTGARRFLGSVPNSVAHHAGCGVLIVPTQLRSQPGGPELTGGSIVVGTDGSDTAMAALGESIRVAKALGGELHILSGYKHHHIGEKLSNVPREQAPLSQSLVDAVLEDAASRARIQGVKAEMHATDGDTADALLDLAASLNAAMIVVGSRGMHGAHRFALGNVPSRISHKGTCSVLIVFTEVPAGQAGAAQPDLSKATT